MREPSATKSVYDGKQFDVVVETWGERAREIVRHPGATAIVAVDCDGCVTLVQQLREPARKELLELPAGTLEEGEDPLTTAQRELAEETGLHGGRWRELGAFFTTPGFCNERMHVFLAEDVERGDADPEKDEDVAVVRWPLSELEQRLDELEDGKTLAGLLLYLHQRA